MLFQFSSLCLSAAAHAATVSDEYLTGYLSSILERELYWPHTSYRLLVERGVATITLQQDDATARRQATERFAHIDGLHVVQFKIVATVAEVTAVSPNIADQSSQGTAYPVGDVFRPLLADPRQPNFYISLREYDMPSEQMTTMAVGLGETFGLYRYAGQAPGDGVQISIMGGVFGLFNLNVPNREMVNADYKVGVPITWRQGNNSVRLQIYHQSSHLGDGYLQRVQPEVQLLTFEAVSILYSYEWQGLRGYVGGEYRFDYPPSELKPWVWQGGIEYYGSQQLLGDARLVAGVDIKCLQQHHYAVDSSIQIGIEFGGREPGQRRLRLVLEGYHGYSPDGQLYDNILSAYGVGVHLGL